MRAVPNPQMARIKADANWLQEHSGEGHGVTRVLHGPAGGALLNCKCGEVRYMTGWAS